MRVVRLLAMAVLSLPPNRGSVIGGPSHCQCLAVAVGERSSVYEFTGHFTAARPSYIRKQSLTSLNYEHGLLFYSRHGTWALDASVAAGKSVLLKNKAKKGSFAQLRPERITGRWDNAKRIPLQVDIQCTPCTAESIQRHAMHGIQYMPKTNALRPTPSLPRETTTKSSQDVQHLQHKGDRGGADRMAQEKVLEQQVEAEDANILRAERQTLQAESNATQTVTKACKKQIVTSCLKEALLADQYRQIYNAAAQNQKIKLHNALEKAGAACEACVQERKKKIDLGLVTGYQCSVKQVDKFCPQTRCTFCYGDPTSVVQELEEQAGEEALSNEAGEAWALTKAQRDGMKEFAKIVAQLETWWPNAPTTTRTRTPQPNPMPAPTRQPTITPTQIPTVVPTQPTQNPTQLPTRPPSNVPTHAAPPKPFPTPAPRCNHASVCSCAHCCNTFIAATAERCLECIKEECTNSPTLSPSPAPTTSPSGSPTQMPTSSPTPIPTPLPTNIPTNTPSPRPTLPPTAPPTLIPTEVPSWSPTESVELKRETVFFSKTFMLGIGPYLRPTGLGDNPRNLQPSYKACSLQCESLPKCKFGTYLETGDRAQECWLAAHNYITAWRETQVLCGTPCKSFHVRSRKRNMLYASSSRLAIPLTVTSTFPPTMAVSARLRLPTFAPTGAHRFEDDDFAPATVKTRDPMWPPSPLPPSNSPTLPTHWPTNSPTLPTPTPTLGGAVLTALQGPCQALSEEASDKCANLYGHAYECVQKCEGRIMARKHFAGPERHQMDMCPVAWRRVVREHICWPHDCRPVMKYFCGDYIGHIGMAVKGWDIRYGPQHPAYFDLCKVCVEHYTFVRTPPVQNYPCWIREMKVFCASTHKEGLPPDEQVYVFGKSSRLARPMQWKWDRDATTSADGSSTVVQQWETTELSSNPGLTRQAMRTSTFSEIPPRANIGAFNTMDADKDGFISVSELRRNMGLPKAAGGKDDEADKMVQAADEDGDGQVSYAEFNRMIMQKAQRR